MSTQLVKRQRGIGQLARTDFTDEQVNLIRATVAKDATTAELGMFLELCARYELDPFAGQIYCSKMKGKNGAPGRIAIIVGRDGMLTIANRSPDFKGFDSDVVRKGDKFEVTRTPDGKRAVFHQYAPVEERGDIVGAWAEVYREGRPARFFYAPIEDYLPANLNDFSPWKKQRSVMIQKCAESTALRLAFEITGLMGEEEGAHQLTSADVPIPPDEIEWGDDEALADRLAQLFTTANFVRQDSYLPAKIKMMLAGKTQGERQDIAAELEHFIEEHGGTVPDPPEPMEGEVVDEPEDEDVQGYMEEGDEGEAHEA
jgi:phage recombination protein Bet